MLPELATKNDCNSVLQDQLDRALTRVNRAVGVNKALPILNCLALTFEGAPNGKAYDGRCIVSATDLETTAYTWIGAMVRRPVTMIARRDTLPELVHLYSPERVDMVWDDAAACMELRCGMSHSHAQGYPPEEMPPMPMPDFDAIAPLAVVFDAPAAYAAIKPLTPGKDAPPALVELTPDALRIATPDTAIEIPVTGDAADLAYRVNLEPLKKALTQLRDASEVRLYFHSDRLYLVGDSFAVSIQAEATDKRQHARELVAVGAITEGYTLKSLCKSGKDSHVWIDLARGAAWNDDMSLPLSLMPGVGALPPYALLVDAASLKRAMPKRGRKQDTVPDVPYSIYRNDSGALLLEVNGVTLANRQPQGIGASFTHLANFIADAVRAAVITPRVMLKDNTVYVAVALDHVYRFHFFEATGAHWYENTVVEELRRADGKTEAQYIGELERKYSADGVMSDIERYCRDIRHEEIVPLQRPTPKPAAISFERAAAFDPANAAAD